MKAASISELRKTLRTLDHDRLQESLLRLARFKVDNKELLTYLLYQSDDERSYVENVCDEIDELLPAGRSIPKKTLRKIVRRMDKLLRFSGNKETELEVRIHFCQRLVTKRVSFGRCRVSANMYASQLKKIDKALETVHPDLQYDFQVQMEGIDSLVSRGG